MPCILPSCRQNNLERVHAWYASFIWLLNDLYGCRGGGQTSACLPFPVQECIMKPSHRCTGTQTPFGCTIRWDVGPFSSLIARSPPRPLVLREAALQTKMTPTNQRRPSSVLFAGSVLTAGDAIREEPEQCNPDINGPGGTTRNWPCRHCPLSATPVAHWIC
jgi:hypothetical protein